MTVSSVNATVDTFAAGKNKIINGDFGVWQRGTSFSSPAAGSYLADRFGCGFDGTGATRTFSQQTFTPGTAPVSGYEGTYYLRLAQSVAGSGGSYNLITQTIEDVRTLSGQTVTISFWAKAAAGFTFGQVDMYQYFGTGGSSAVTNAASSSDASVTTSWKRFVHTLSLPSVSGKTIGTGSYVQLRIWLPTNTTFTFDIWGVQVEAGAVATSFQTASGSVGGELDLCQRYYYRSGSGTLTGAYWRHGMGLAQTTTGLHFLINLPVAMRIVPTVMDTSTLSYLCAWDGSSAIALTGLTIDQQSNVLGCATATVASGLTQYRPYELMNNNNAGGYVGFSAEL